MTRVNLNFGFHFSDLYNREGLVKLDDHFLGFLKQYDHELYQVLLHYRIHLPIDFPSEFILKLSAVVEDFLAQLFNIATPLLELQTSYNSYASVVKVKRNFVQRLAIKKYANLFDDDSVCELFSFQDELSFAEQILQWLDHEQDYQHLLDQAARYAAWATLTKNGQAKHQDGILFKKPSAQNFDALIPNLVRKDNDSAEMDEVFIRHREGFKLTDHGMNRAQAFDQANYCIWCHHQGKDSCAKGMKPRQDSIDRFAKNPLNQELTGCPLDQKISEMNELVSQGSLLAALAVICIDNPLVAATGHRICNDCTKACIFQKQEPVQIPATETKILKDVLNLPWGFEIYSLLTRWNPLNLKNPLPKPLTNKNVLVVGMGPAGFTLAHYLLNEGHTVIGIDALKIEPLPSSLVMAGEGMVPIQNIQDLYESLDERTTWGFGGVAEYGITVRWDKNFLKIIRLLLERREHFSMFGGVRFGGTLTIDQAFELGIDHVALCMGAGGPTTLNIKNSLATGVRQASDFLMALQLGGAFKKNSLTSLQLQLPVVVVGGGLTAIDTATEAMAYYPVQVENFSKRFEEISNIYGKDRVWGIWNKDEQEIARTFLNHAALFNAEREIAQQEKRQLDFQKIIKKLGGVRIIYRKSLQESPSYRSSHEELAKAFEEGVQFIENSMPIELITDSNNHVEGIKVQQNDGVKVFPAKSVLVAAGTIPNISLIHDVSDQIKLMQHDGKNFFQAIDQNKKQIIPELNCKPLNADILTRLDDDGRAVTFFGDQHPSFEGNVVKAMASAKRGHPFVTQLLENVEHSDLLGAEETIAKWKYLLCAHIADVKVLNSKTFEFVIKAPLAARGFKPGQFFRLQNFEKGRSALVTEGIALTGISANQNDGTISTIIVEKGASTSICQKLKKDDPIIFMGPTGGATYIPIHKKVLLVAEDIGNASLFETAQLMRDQQCEIVYIAGYRSVLDVFNIEKIRQVSDHIIWCFDDGDYENFSHLPKQEAVFQGNAEQALAAYCQGDYDFSIKPAHIQYMLVMVGGKTLSMIEKIYQESLKNIFHAEHAAFVTINSPMQCMMKKVCGQCLQTYQDPGSGEKSIIFNCVKREHSIGTIDLNVLSSRLNQNTVHEKLNTLWANLTV